MRYVICGEDADVNGPLGGKARALAALRQADLPIPNWIALTPEAFYASLTPEQRAALDAEPAAESIADLVAHLRPAPAGRAQLAQALAALFPAQAPVRG